MTDQPDERIPGSCLCGAVAFRIRLPTLFCGHCHCSMCRRNHGAGFVTWTSVERPQLEVTAGAERLTRFQSSPRAVRAFCSVCGTSLFFETEDRPDHVDIPLANLAGEIDRVPEFHCHYDDAVPWSGGDDSLPKLGGPSGLDPLES